MKEKYLGNIKLLELQKTAFLAPSRIDIRSVMKCYDWATDMCRSQSCVVSGFSSRMEKEVLQFLLRGNQPIIIVMSRRMYAKLPEEWQKPLEQERLLIISVSDDVRQSRTNALRRNLYVAQLANDVVMPNVPPKDSSLHEIYTQIVSEGKPLHFLIPQS